MRKEESLIEDEKNLIRRYLIWCYKTTKEDLDKIDRYFTQIKIDNFILEDLISSKGFSREEMGEEYQGLIFDFKEYILQKESSVLKKKYKNVENKRLNADYEYLKNRFESIKKAILFFGGKEELECIRDLYEKEMVKRILQAKEHS